MNIDGFDLVKTCSANPEQYDVFLGKNQVGYLRLRHGEFRADFGECGGETVYTAKPKGDGVFEDDERADYLSAAIAAIRAKVIDRIFDGEDVIVPDAPTTSAETGCYVIWSNEHRAWWGPNRSGYRAKLEDAGRYTRDEAVRICTHARGGRQFNHNPSEVPLLESDAAEFWSDDTEEWLRARQQSDSERERVRDLLYMGVPAEERGDV
ncbi:hypothetical protein [Nisaea sediminum]|uniref:hypothetical protein n=1 Tax=Nisaea sediminum TaxID=2775867 RepID=UPI001D027889|nr:hypothetical protein [Nisaea sediminum]